MLPTEIYQTLLTDVGPWDLDWNVGLVPVHYNRWGPNKSINYETGILLKNFADKLDAKVILEVGTFRGYSTCWLLISCYLRGKGHVFTFDTVKEGGYGEPFYDKYGFSRERLTFVHGPVWDRDKTVFPESPRIDLVFHDSSHELVVTVREVEVLAPLVRVGGIMLFDDVLLPIYQPMKEFLEIYFTERSKEWKYGVLPLGHGLGIAERIG